MPVVNVNVLSSSKFIASYCMYICLASLGEEHLLPFSERCCGYTEQTFEAAEHSGRGERGRVLTASLLFLRPTPEEHDLLACRWSCRLHTNEAKTLFCFHARTPDFLHDVTVFSFDFILFVSSLSDTPPSLTSSCLDRKWGKGARHV